MCRLIGPGSLHLQIDSRLISRVEGGLRRTIAVETKMIEPVVLSPPHDPPPALKVGRRAMWQRKDAAFNRSTEHHWPPVQREPSGCGDELAPAEASVPFL